MVPASAVAEPDALAVEVRIDGALVQRCDTGDRVRTVARLIADVSAFMSLWPGDLLLLGAAPVAPRARRGQTVEVSIAGIGHLRQRLAGQGRT
jgi:5-oxopent-3-ene-1,2,5-tricarboxylate decarboxylase/2-hydroxyhepta-2,4-diene-1,7-dioate isomerase